MKKINLYSIFLMTIYTVYIIEKISNASNNIKNHESSINNVLKFKSEKNISFIYNQQGKLKCKLITKYIQFFDNTKNIYITQPITILFNEANIPIWNICAKQAEITQNKIMYLYGNVQIINLKKNPYFQLITTNTATLNLITYDIFSNKKITVHGTFFHAIAMNLEGNLYTKKIKLSKTIYTLYDTKYAKKA